VHMRRFFVSFLSFLGAFIGLMACPHKLSLDLLVRTDTSTTFVCLANVVVFGVRGVYGVR